MHYKTISELAPLIESGELSPVDLTRSQLERIEALDGTLKSFATITGELAIEQAEIAQKEIAIVRIPAVSHRSFTAIGIP